MAPGKKPATKVAPKSTVGSPSRVTLSKARLATLALISDPKAKEALRAEWVAQIQVQHEKNAAYLARRNDLNMVITELGFLAVNGTGTRRNAIFSKAQALAFIDRFEEFKELVEQMPDAPVDAE